MEIITNKNYIRIVIMFAAFVLILLYSYLFKLGYLKIFTYLIFILILMGLFMNFLKDNYRPTTLFWIILLMIFSYALSDKYLKIHEGLESYIPYFSSVSPAVAINIIYIVAFFIVMSFFYKFLFNEFKNNSEWLYVFIFAVILKIISIAVDFEFHDITEDYFEAFSLYFFLASFLLAYISNRKDHSNENSNISSAN